MSSVRPPTAEDKLSQDDDGRGAEEGEEVCVTSCLVEEEEDVRWEDQEQHPPPDEAVVVGEHWMEEKQGEKERQEEEEECQWEQIAERPARKRRKRGTKRPVLELSSGMELESGSSKDPEVVEEPPRKTPLHEAPPSRGTGRGKKGKRGFPPRTHMTLRNHK